jgi:hypothetical protein
VAGTPEGQAERVNVSGAIEDWNAAVRQTMRVEHHAECDRSQTKTSHHCAPAESTRTNRDASCASACPAKAGPYHNCGSRAHPNAATFCPQRQRNAGGGAVCGRGFRKSRMSVRHCRVGQPAVKGLSLRRNEELRHDEARSLHV